MRQVTYNYRPSYHITLLLSNPSTINYSEFLCWVWTCEATTKYSQTFSALPSKITSHLRICHSTQYLLNYLPAHINIHWIRRPSPFESKQRWNSTRESYRRVVSRIYKVWDNQAARVIMFRLFVARFSPKKEGRAARDAAKRIATVESRPRETLALARIFAFRRDGSSRLLSVSAPRHPELINNLVIRRDVRAAWSFSLRDEPRIINWNATAFTRPRNDAPRQPRLIKNSAQPHGKLIARPTVYLNFHSTNWPSRMQTVGQLFRPTITLERQRKIAASSEVEISGIFLWFRGGSGVFDRRSWRTRATEG